MNYIFESAEHGIVRIFAWDGIDAVVSLSKAYGCDGFKYIGKEAA